MGVSYLIVIPGTWKLLRRKPHESIGYITQSRERVRIPENLYLHTSSAIKNELIALVYVFIARIAMLAAYLDRSLSGPEYESTD